MLESLQKLPVKMEINVTGYEDDCDGEDDEFANLDDCTGPQNFTAGFQTDWQAVLRGYVLCKFREARVPGRVTDIADLKGPLLKRIVRNIRY